MMAKKDESDNSTAKEHSFKKKNFDLIRENCRMYAHLNGY